MKVINVLEDKCRIIEMRMLPSPAEKGNSSHGVRRQSLIYLQYG